MNVNIYGVDNLDQVYPLKVCRIEKGNHFDPLIITNEALFHYCYRQFFSRLVRAQITKFENKTKFSIIPGEILQQN